MDLTIVKPILLV